jgi:hypothetical protein
MPTKRRKRRPTYVAINLTEQMVHCWHQGDDAGIRRLLGVKVYAVWSPFWSPGPEPDQDDPRHVTWLKWSTIRDELMAICPPGRSDRHGLPIGPA